MINGCALGIFILFGQYPAGSYEDLPAWPVVKVATELALPNDVNTDFVDSPANEDWPNVFRQQLSEHRRAPVYFHRDKSGLRGVHTFTMETGKLSGASLSLYANGAVYALLNFRESKRHGIVRLWSETGERLLCSQYREGKLQGPAVVFHQDRPRLVEVFDNGQVATQHLVFYRKVADAGDVEIDDSEDIEIDSQGPVLTKHPEEFRYALSLKALAEEELNKVERDAKSCTRTWYGKQVYGVKKAIAAESNVNKRNNIMNRAREQDAANNRSMQDVRRNAAGS